MVRYRSEIFVVFLITRAKSDLLWVRWNFNLRATFIIEKKLVEIKDVRRYIFTKTFLMHYLVYTMYNNIVRPVFADTWNPNWQIEINNHHNMNIITIDLSTWEIKTINYISLFGSLLKDTIIYSLSILLNI